ncbi:unnamed protein product [Amoebophrya sp. A120]|nr:unnamed protein product [Amoebophrya sp. A120]|eukprot:GSA120T00011885001.1
MMSLFLLLYSSVFLPAVLTSAFKIAPLGVTEADWNRGKPSFSASVKQIYDSAVLKANKNAKIAAQASSGLVVKNKNAATASSVGVVQNHINKQAAAHLTAVKDAYVNTVRNNSAAKPKEKSATVTAQKREPVLVRRTTSAGNKAWSASGPTAVADASAVGGNKAKARPAAKNPRGQAAAPVVTVSKISTGVEGQVKKTAAASSLSAKKANTQTQSDGPVQTAKEYEEDFPVDDANQNSSAASTTVSSGSPSSEAETPTVEEEKPVLTKDGIPVDAKPEEHSAVTASTKNAADAKADVVASGAAVAAKEEQVEEMKGKQISAETSQATAASDVSNAQDSLAAEKQNANAEQLEYSDAQANVAAKKEELRVATEIAEAARKELEEANKRLEEATARVAFAEKQLKKAEDEARSATANREAAEAALLAAQKALEQAKEVEYLAEQDLEALKQRIIDRIEGERSSAVGRWGGSAQLFGTTSLMIAIGLVGFGFW